MSIIACIDMGTTNTRISIWHGSQMLGCASDTVGVRNKVIENEKKRLESAVKKVYESALVDANITHEQLDFIIGIGMITSNMGLYEIPHIEAPISLSDLADAMKLVYMDMFGSKKFFLVPGVKTASKRHHDMNLIDFMRGEEAECFALINRLHITSNSIIILPGSHCKMIEIDEKFRISDFFTTFSGELLDTITNNTILSESLEHRFAEEISSQYILMGAASAAKWGFTKACFQIRTMERESHISTNELSNFLLGAVTYMDIQAIKTNIIIKDVNHKQIFISAHELVAQAYGILLEKDDFFEGTITIAAPKESAWLSAAGGLLLAKERGLIS